MVCGSRPRASAVAAAVQPWAKSQRACQRSRSRGVGARMSRRCNPLASISHCRRIRPISLTPIANPYLNPRQAIQVHHQFTPCFCAFHPGFSLVLQPHIHPDSTFGPSISLVSSIVDPRTTAEFDGRQVPLALKPVICGCSTSPSAVGLTKNVIRPQGSNLCIPSATPFDPTRLDFLYDAFPEQLAGIRG